MNKFLAITAAAAMLSACADTEEAVVVPTDTTVDIDVDGDVDGEDDVVVTITNGTVSVGDLAGATLEGGDLRVRIVGLDGPDNGQVFNAVAVDRPDEFEEFELQISSLNRDYSALAKNSEDGSITAVVVVDGGQFNKFFGGATVSQNSYEAPGNTTASYSGGYVGLLNGGGVGDTPTPDGSPDAATPNASAQILGSVFVNANFSDKQIEGLIYNRETTLFGADYDIADVVLTVGSINDDGTFAATAERRDQASVGSYSGVLGGNNATSVGGAINLTGDFLVDRELEDIFDDDSGIDTGAAVEYGVFVLERCGALGDDCFAD